MENLYVLECTGPDPTIVELTVKHVKCGTCGVRGVARIGSYAVRFTTKDELADVTHTPEGVVVRQSVVDHLTEACISGWRQGYLQIQAGPHLGSCSLDYHELIIIGHTRGFAERTNLRIERECPECGLRRFVRPEAGLSVPEDCWDRSDIFVVDELPGIRIVTEAFHQVIRKYRHTGVAFVPIDEWRDPLGWIK